VPLPVLPAVTRRVRRIPRPTAPAEPVRPSHLPAALLPVPPRTVAAKAADRSPSREELVTLLELEGPAATDPGERAEQARRTASRYLRERRRRLRRELGVERPEDGGAG
jgi:DNA-directed RNA polymerase specialized sigma24 family protein